MIYTYDGDGKRAKKSGAMVYWYGMTSDPLEETAPAGALQNDYIFFGGERIARLDATGDIFAYLADHLGSSRKMREIASGATTSTAAYDADFYPFGREHVFTSGSPIYKFEGKIRDTDTGLDDFGARYYSSNIGRFMSSDWSAVPAPVPYANPTNPQTLNLYAMVSDNPETFNDLDGHGCGLSLSGSGDISCENTYTVGGVTGENSGTRSPQTTGDGLPPSDSQAEANEISNQQNQDQQPNAQSTQQSASGINPNFKLPSFNLADVCNSSACTKTLAAASNFAAGAGDALTLGLDTFARKGLSALLGNGYGESVNRATVAYGAGVATGTAVGVALGKEMGPQGKIFGTRFGGNQPLFNSGDTFRVGWSYIKASGQYVFRIGGTAVGLIKDNPHINLWPPSWWFK